MSRRYTQLIAGLISTLGATGCLSVGGTITAEDPEMQNRITSLETRVSALEQCRTCSPTGSAMLPETKVEELAPPAPTR